MTGAPFSGFPARTEATPLPEAFFSEVLPEIADLAELKAVLVAFRRIRRRKGAVRWVLASELASAPELGRLGAAATEGEAAAREAALRAALGQAVERGVLLAVALDDGRGRTDTAYFVNDPEGRRAAEQVRGGKATIDGAPPPAAPRPRKAGGEPLSIFRLYEDTIGPVPGAGLADELTEAERTFPAAWLREAFHEAAAQNVRRWAYVRAILTRWRDEGRREDGATERRSAQERYRAGKYGRVVRWK